jgi:hypothetical protein
MKDYVRDSGRYKAIDKHHNEVKRKLFEGDCAKFALQAICQHSGTMDMADIMETIKGAFDDFSCDNGWSGYQNFVDAMETTGGTAFNPFAAPDEYTREFVDEEENAQAEHALMLDALTEIVTRKCATPDKTLESVKIIASETLCEVCGTDD